MRRTGYDYLEIYRFLERMDYVFFEPRHSLVEPAPIRVWSGEEGEDWDLLAVPSERVVRDGACAAAPSAVRAGQAGLDCPGAAGRRAWTASEGQAS